MIFITKRIPCLDFLKPYRSTNITGFDKVDRILLVGKHLHDTADTLFLTASYVQHIRAGIQVTAIAPEEGQTTHKRIGHDLEIQSGKWFLCIGRPLDRFT